MSECYIGLMSGTSMDALDAVAVDFSGPQPQLMASLSAPLPPKLQRQLLSLCSPGENELDRAAVADRELGRFSAEVVRQLLLENGLSPQQITAIGSHGQTIRHAPGASLPYSVQIGDGNTIAQQTGITTVCDFRRRDIAAGGQGAPLVPAFHAAILRSTDIDRVVVNIGGMANISILPAASSVAVSGFDTGPGNVLLDSWCRQHREESFDRDGQWAASGNVDEALLGRLQADPYFQLSPPKSTGREYFNSDWLEQHLGPGCAAEDVQASLCELTARTIASAIRQYAPLSREVIVCGGGAYNLELMRRLQHQIEGVSLSDSDKFGIAPRWMEAIAFAWLARRTLLQQPGNLPAVTGASEAVILGAIYRS